MSRHDPIRVGVLFSKTGSISTIETSQLMGTLFAIDEINEHGGIDGREIEPVHYDPESSAGRYRVLAERLITQDQVNVIFGCYSSGTRKAVLPIVERWNRLLFYPTLYEGFECSGNVIYTGSAPNQNAVPLAKYMASNYGVRVYLIGSDYIYPYESNRTMTDLLEKQKGGEKVGEEYVPLNAQPADFEAIIRNVKNVQPDFIFSTVVGNSTKYLYRAYADAGLDPAKMPIASLTTLEAEVREMGVDAAAGHISSAPYFQSVASDINERCLAAFRRKFGTTVEPNAGWEAAYFQMHLFARAMALSGSDSIEALMPRLLDSEFDAPQGRVRIDPSNHHTYLYPRIGIVSSVDGQFKIVQQVVKAVKPDPYLVANSLGDWALRADAEVGY